MADLLIIGAGLTGLMAAHAAVSAGHQVRVVAKGWGALYWTAGTIDVLGYLPQAPAEPVKRPLEAMQQLLAARPAHPYALVDGHQIVTALAAFVALSKEIGVPYAGADTPGENLMLPSPAGALRPTYLAPNGQLAGDVHLAEPMVIVGFHGLRDFYPALIADNLSKQGVPARAAHLPLSLLTDRRDSNTVQLAEGLDHKERWPELATALQRLVRPGERIGLPAVLGMEKHLMLLSALERETGTAVFEIPTLPPSVPGIRLFQAMVGHLRSRGVRVEPGMEVIGADVTAANGKRGFVNWVESATSARPMKHRAQRFLLASGGLLGGGFTSDISGRVWEPIFNLPLTIPQQRDRWFKSGFLDVSGHPVFRGGIRVNGAWQPLDDQEQPLFANLWAAGNGLAAADTIQERSFEGTAVVTGMAAVQAMDALENDYAY